MGSLLNLLYKLTSKQIISIAALLLGLTGTIILVFGLKVRGGTDPELLNKIRTSEEVTSPSEVRQKLLVICFGLFLIGVAVLLQICVILQYP